MCFCSNLQILCKCKPASQLLENIKNAVDTCESGGYTA